MAKVGQVIREEFSMEEIDRIYENLLHHQNEGNPAAYVVRVDGLTAISRTTDPEKMQGILSHVNLSRSKEVEISIYAYGASNHCDKFFLRLSENFPTPEPTGQLSGMDVDDRIQAALARQQRDFEFSNLRQDYDNLKTEHEKLETYTDQLEAELKTFRSKKLHWGNVDLGELGGIFLEGFVRRNPQILHRLPMGQALAGAIEADNAEQVAALTAGTENETQADESTGKASFEMDDAAETDSQDDRLWLSYLRLIQANFGEEQASRIMGILKILIEQPEKIKVVHELLH